VRSSLGARRASVGLSDYPTRLIALLCALASAAKVRCDQ
jgi:hypothetical protein